MPNERAEPVKTGEKCTTCGNDIVEKDGRFGKFFSCNNYPECKVIYTKTDDGKFVVKEKKQAKKTGQKCIKCKTGNIVIRNGKFGEFYACDGYPKCKCVYIKEDNGSFSEKLSKSYKKTEEDSE